MKKSSLQKQVSSLEEETFDLISKITWLLKEYNLWEPDDTFTFGDGDKWGRFDPEYELELSQRTKENPEDYTK